METVNTLVILALAFGLGMLHALDADHIMAVSGLASNRPGLTSSVQFCLRWAFGHGLILLTIAITVFLLGQSIPDSLSHIAESLVGAVLIVIGLLLLWNLFKSKAHLHFHRHDGLPRHAHWHVHEQCHQLNPQQDEHHHEHTAVMVGMLHGTAGSAPLLAIIPVAQLPSPWTGMLYVMLFSLGVIVTMLLFGGVIGMLFNTLMRYGTRFIYALRTLVAFSAITFGTVLLKSAF